MSIDWRSVPCLKCNRRGLHVADHPHARGYKDYEHVACRFCDAVFPTAKLEDSLSQTREDK